MTANDFSETAALVATPAALHSLPTLIHEPDVGRPCVHLLASMPQRLHVSRAAVARLSFQPRYMLAPQPVIAARRGDTLILSVDLLGPLSGRHPRRGGSACDCRVKHHWHFDLAAGPGDETLTATLIGKGQPPS
jgi:hypothetical protein